MFRILMKQDYFQSKDNAEDIIKLQDYLIRYNITEEKIKDRGLTRTILCQGTKAFAKMNPTTLELDTFQHAILNFTIGHLKKVKLFRINYGILLVACVEHLLYPEEDNEEYMMIYSCDEDKAIKVYRTLRGFPSTPDGTLSRSARSFFNCTKFLEDNQYLKAIRSYLRSLQFDNEDMQYIREKSIKLILGNEVNDIVELPANCEIGRLPRSDAQLPQLINREFFEKKSNARFIINLVDCLNNQYNISEESLRMLILSRGGVNFVSRMLREVTRSFDWRPSRLQLISFRNTILDYTIDHLKTVNLYRINHGILTVACVEYALYPDGDNEEYMRIYRCDTEMATVLYNRLYGYEEDTPQDSHVVESTRSFFRCPQFSRNIPCLDAIRLYLSSIEIDNVELEDIKKKSLELIVPPEVHALRLIGPGQGILMNATYFREKSNADTIINIVNYIKINGIIYNAFMDSETIFQNILRETTRTFANENPTPWELHEFKITMLNFTSHYLKKVKLYRINYGILAVACIEHVLYPKDDDRYMKIYRGEYQKVIEAYNKLCDLPVKNKPVDDTVRSARSFFNFKNRIKNNDAYLSIVRRYLRDIDIDEDDDEKQYIKEKAKELIHEGCHRQPAENRIDPIGNIPPM
ncbi:uncharacterized protein LOC106654684 isoform X2 [Trichogramma pretiosum]|uniref:uncharacterized protein LOC106654684 isoform X2 n=1 Tax=Trichogramma pretiosum TaxID=7493 RepID=UPI000C719CD9|nr:uncharacterized protein LOC106654684 isoform X2 [Trichogramma pretiosum]